MLSVAWDPDIEHFAFNDGSGVTKWYSPDKLASLLLDFTPIIGDAKGFIEGVIGQDLVTGKSLTPVDRFLGLVFLSEVRGIKKGIDVFDAAFDAVKHASTPVGRKGKEIQVPRSNKPAKIAGRDYSGHALDRMQERGLTPSAVENTIQHGSVRPGRDPGTTAHYDSRNNLTVITNETGGVVTARRGKP
jgi:filamentous hemagglutinin